MLIGTGIALFAESVKILNWSPPNAKIAVEGTKYPGLPGPAPPETLTKNITVSVDDLVPLETETKKSTRKVRT